MRNIKSYYKFNEGIEWTPELRQMLDNAKEDIKDIFIDSLEDITDLKISSFLVENASSGDISFEITLSLYKGSFIQRWNLETESCITITPDLIESIIRFFNYCGVDDKSLDNKTSIVKTVKAVDTFNKSSKEYTYLDILNKSDDLIGKSFVEVYVNCNLPIS